jgi:sulfotransferase family protein
MKTTLIKQGMESVVREFMVRCLSNYFPLYIVNEYPKSGGTWLGQMLGNALGVPFPRNCMPNLTSSIMHDHYYYPWGMKNVVVLFRDGRDVMVSWYHHCLFYNERGNARLVDMVRKDLQFDNVEDVQANLCKFIEYSFTTQKHPSYSWGEFVTRWIERDDIIWTRYEDLRVNAASELQRIVLFLSGNNLSDEIASKIVEKYSFSKQTGRKPGEEEKSSFLRKGIVGDWENYFDQCSKQAFDHYAGDELIKLGYETDRAWLTSDRLEKALLNKGKTVE